MWARVFTSGADAPAPEALVEHLRAAGYAAEARAEADELGWFHLELSTSAGDVTLDRYGKDEGIRDDLNSWAAWLEVHAGAHAGRLMQHMIGCGQIVTLRVLQDGDADLRRLLHTVLKFSATASGGVYQVDGEGFFDSAGTLLVAEDG
jgi:hypothetical protein